MTAPGCPGTARPSDASRTPHWQPPEALAAAKELARLRRAPSVDRAALIRAENAATVQNKETDVYKFGLMVVRVLDHGRGRAVNRDPGRAAGILRRALGGDAEGVLRRSLAADPRSRPTMHDWYQVFRPAPAAGGARPPARIREGGPGPAPGHPAVVPDGRVNGNWVFVQGTGWVRRPAGRS